MQKKVIRQAIKKEAKNKSKKTLSLALLIILIIFTLLTLSAYLIINLTSYSYNIKVINDLIIGIILILISPLILSFSKLVLETIKDKPTKLQDIFTNIKEFKFIKLFGILVIGLIFIIWLLGFIPGVGTFINLVILILYLPLFIIMPFIYLDNKELSKKEIIAKTENIISGNRITFYGLLISFIPWLIISIFTFGILLFYVIPYMYLSFGYLYQSFNHDKEFKKNKAISDGNIILVFIGIIAFLIIFLVVNIPSSTVYLKAIITGQIDTKIGNTTLSYGGVEITYDCPKNYKNTAATNTSKTYMNEDNYNVLQYSIYLSEVNKMIEMDKEIVNEMRASGKKIIDEEFTINIKDQKIKGYKYVVNDSNSSSSVITVYYPKGDFTVNISLSNDSTKLFSKEDIKEFITIY